jgi:hypothetical protein
LAGLAADHLSPAWGFVAVGGVGALIALLVLPTEIRRRSTPIVSTVPAQPTADDVLDAVAPAEAVGAQAGPAGAAPPPAPR